MLKVKLRHLNLLEGELNAASEDALRIAIPIRSEGPHEDRAVLRPSDCKEGQNTEQRWLGRMVTNTLGEIRKRADLCDSKGAMLKVDIENEATEVDKLLQSKKRKLAEIAELKSRVSVMRRKVLDLTSSRCASWCKALRPAEAAAAEAGAERRAAAQAVESLRGRDVLAEISPLQEKARQCVEELAGGSELLARRVESLGQTSTAVTSLLKSKPSRVDKAIRQGPRDGLESRKSARERPGAGGYENNPANREARAPADEETATPALMSGISLLSAHLRRD